MKRYRVLAFDFDARVVALTSEIRAEWEERVKEMHRRNQENLRRNLIDCYGDQEQDRKLRDFIDLGGKPLSILAFHNRFFEQARTAFIMGAYYPALTGTCALGERILNHLILVLREDHKDTPEYKVVYRKDSFDDWEMAITTLVSWDVLLPVVAEKFRFLMDIRHKAIHFRPEVDHNERALALKAIHCLSDIIGSQFGAFGPQPWFIADTPGEAYIKKSWERKPFIQKTYLPNCLLVGPKNRIEAMFPQIIVNDNFEYEAREITDEEFASLRKQRNE